MLENTVRTLFLHGGPGLNAGVERIWFGDSLQVDWWDQPAVPPCARSPFEFLVHAAEKRLCTLARSDAPIALLAHSFGARLAVELVRRQPSRITHITLLAGIFDLTSAFIALAKTLIIKQCPSRELRSSLALAGDSHNFQAVRKLVEELLTTPGMSDHFWAPQSHRLRERFNTIAATALHHDTTTLFAVLEEGLENSLAPAPAGYSGPVRLLMGKHDPLLEIERDLARWQVIFPGLQLDICEAGHNPHFELPVWQWL